MKQVTHLRLLAVVLLLLLVACTGAAQTPSQQTVGAPTAPVAAQATDAPGVEAPTVTTETDATQAGATSAAPAGQATGLRLAEEGVQVPTSFNEAPMLADQVKAGTLPPVEQRLPKDIQVVTPVEEVGQYGGTWSTVHWDSANPSNLKLINYDPPVRWKPDYSGYEPGLAKSVEWSPDGTTVTWHFREGVKWSDGQPFTTDDLKFWWEEMANAPDQKLFAPPFWAFAGGQKMEVTFPNKYSMVMKWATPQWIAPYILAQGFWEWEPLMRPKHYLEKLHPKNNPSTTWEDFAQKAKWWQNPEYPVLFAWRTVEFTPGARFVFERNPYYWKVDTQGNQLPYIDRIESEEVSDAQVRLVNITQGKYTASFRGVADPLQLPLLAENAEAGDYRLLPWMNGAGAWPAWTINQNYVDDQQIRALLRNPKFRQGISHALDRQRVIDVVWGGIGTPQQMTLSPQSWHFQGAEGQKIFQEWQNAYAKHDQATANRLLDEAGMSKRDAEGKRTLPDGSRFELVIDVADFGNAVGAQGSQVLEENLEAVGIRTLLNNLTGNVAELNLRQGEGKFMMRNQHVAEMDIWTFPAWLFPTAGGRDWPMVGKWYQTGGKEGVAPEPGSPEERLLKLYDQGRSEPDIQKRHEIVWEAIRIHIDEGPFILGAAGDQPMPVVVKNNFLNVPENGIVGPTSVATPGNMHPEQFFIKQ